MDLSKKTSVGCKIITIISVPPFVRPVESSKVVLLGGNVTLQCNAMGFPIPEIVWEHEGVELAENSTNLR